MAGETEVKPNQEAEDSALIGDFLEGYMPPAGGDKPKEADPPADDGTPKQIEEPKPVEAKPVEGEAKPADGIEPPPDGPKPPDAAAKTYEYRGRQYTVDQLIEQGVLEDALQTARQFPTIQTKYQQLLEQTKLGGAPAAPAGTASPPQPVGPSADQILTAYAPVMERSAGEGYIEKEAYEAFPRLVSSLMFHRDLLYDVRQAVALLMKQDGERESVNQRTTFRSFLDNLCIKVSAQGEHFALISDPEVQKGFYEYLASLNAPAKDVNEEFLKRQWVAYNSEAVLEAAKTAVSGRKAAAEKARRNAAGEGSGVRPAAPAKGEKTADTAMIDSFLDGDKRFAAGG